MNTVIVLLLSDLCLLFTLFAQQNTGDFGPSFYVRVWCITVKSVVLPYTLVYMLPTGCIILHKTTLKRQIYIFMVTQY